MNFSKDDTQFHIIVASPSDYEELVAEIYVGGKYVALISQEEGGERLKIELPGTDLDEGVIQRVVNLDVFLQAIAAAKARLIKRGAPA
jgi:hypothetical protein